METSLTPQKKEDKGVKSMANFRSQAGATPQIVSFDRSKKWLESTIDLVLSAQKIVRYRFDSNFGHSLALQIACEPTSWNSLKRVQVGTPEHGCFSFGSRNSKKEIQESRRCTNCRVLLENRVRAWGSHNSHLALTSQQQPLGSWRDM